MQHHRAKKSLGQNFLKSKPALRSIITTADLSAESLVLEIGPGKGALTEPILETGAKLIAIEKDEMLLEFLKEKFAQQIGTSQLTLISGDILEIDLEKVLPANTPYKLIANIPYYITGAIIRLFLERKNQPEKMVLMLQKEVAKRIVAQDGKESILSISVKAFGKPKYIETVKAKYFSPEPSVDSAILAISDISNTFFEKFTPEQFFKILKAGFLHKRKRLAKNLESVSNKAAITAAFLKAEISENARSEGVGLEKWGVVVGELGE
jgi:16S rRNA (adenine1518-N6/adenine1519-N6)-dimethyltransferase